MTGFATRAVHGPISRTDAHQGLRPPVYDTVSFGFDSAEEIEQAFAGKMAKHSYSRISNPTVEAFEQRVLLLSGGRGAIAVSSGMAAIANVVLALAGSDTNIVAGRYLFGNTASLFTESLSPWGLETRFVDMSDLKALAGAIDHKTRLVFLESITNPQLEVADLKAITEIAHDKDVPVVLDNTVTTFYLCSSIKLGVDIEVVSSTKYISGGATSVGGLIIDNGIFDWKKSARLAPLTKKFGPYALMAALRQEIYRNLGSCMSPHTAFLQTLGLETLGLRIEKSCANTHELALFLEQHPNVVRVNYPGLPSNPWHGIAQEQFQGRYGGILTFDLESRAHCFRSLNALKLIKRATNINDNKTLALHPSSTIFGEFADLRKEEMGVRPSMIRLSVGIEDVEDLKEDLRQALERKV